jgi:hypothetical protein
MLFYRVIAVAGISSVIATSLDLGEDNYMTRNTGITKIGAAYNNVTLVDSLKHASWAYNWDMYADGVLPFGVEYCPMLWGPKMYDQWHSAALNALLSGSGCLLGFNEPDNAEQANMSPKQAAVDYQTYITPYANQSRLVTPAVTNGVGEIVGLNWLENWFAECNDQCKPDAVAIHYYADSDSADFIDYITAAVTLARRNGIERVWITEFQHTGSVDSQVTFLQDVIPWLVNNTAIERYAYFFVSDRYLLSGTDLSIIGQTYTSTY